jgi:hypothetical protein
VSGDILPVFNQEEMNKMTNPIPNSGKKIDTVDLDDLRGQFKGRVITPNETDFTEASTIFYGGFDKKPAVIIQAAGVEDITRAIDLAGETGLELAVRSGSGKTWYFLLNYKAYPQQAQLARTMNDALTGRALSGTVEVPAYGVLVLTETM